MLKKTLIATAAISATLLAAATVLPALAQSRSDASATAVAPRAQAPLDAASQSKRSADTDTGTRKAERGHDPRKADVSDNDDRYGDQGRCGAGGKEWEKEKHKSGD